ncbi:MAG: exodeoxyribonuclease VII small subunit [Prochlorococcaceae cyanobacterium]
MPEPRSAANRSRASSSASSRQPKRSEPDDASPAAALSYNEARTALDLTIAALQASDLAVEEMAGLYRRATAYAERCQQLLETAEQEVVQWEEPLDPHG